MADERDEKFTDIHGREFVGGYQTKQPDEYDKQAEELLQCPTEPDGFCWCRPNPDAVLMHDDACPDKFRPAVAAALRESGRDRMRGSCRILSVGDECDCGLCMRDKQIADLRAKMEKL